MGIELEQALVERLLADAGDEPGVLPFADGNALTSVRLNQIANTMAARLLAYMPRNSAENTAVDWAKVLQYAQNAYGVDPRPVGTAEAMA